MLLLPIVVAPYLRLLAQALWIIGAVSMVLFACFSLGAFTAVVP